MRFISYLMTLLIAVLVASCGGGNGNPVLFGSDPKIDPKIDPGAAAGSTYPTVATALQTAGGTPTNSISATGYTLLKATLKDPGGFTIANQVISVSGDLTKLSFPEGSTALTDASGIATIKVARASLLATGAGAMTATYDYKPGMIATYHDGSTPPAVASVVTTYVGYQVSTANITLTGMSVGVPATMAAYGTRQVSVVANIDGAPATTTPVLVSFSATCGQVTPVTASTDSTGKVLVTYSATDGVGTTPSTLGCSGKTVQITSSTTGASAVSLNLGVDAAPATNMSFVSATPGRIYLANSGGATQSIVTFQLVNQLGEALAGQSVLLTLKSLNGGIPKASFGSLGSVAPITVSTDSNGKASAPVFSGTIPTNVLVNAALVAIPTIQTDSFVLAIASGRPVQSRLSLALEKRSVEGFNLDGTTTTVTLSLSDRQGNPVPDGTAVNFVTEGGVMIPPICNTGAWVNPATGVTQGFAGNSQCMVTIRSQGTRPGNGLVTILAYAPGEEDFVDANGNNVYDCGESFTDLGLAYRDDRMTSGLVNPYIAGEFIVPRSADTSLCGVGATPSAAAGDGVWGAADVRQQTVIVFATSAAVVTLDSMTSTKLIFMVADRNGNSMPTGSTIAVSGPISEANPSYVPLCNVVSGASTTVPNLLSPMAWTAIYAGCVAGDFINVKVTSPSGLVTSAAYKVP